MFHFVQLKLKYRHLLCCWSCGLAQFPSICKMRFIWLMWDKTASFWIVHASFNSKNKLLETTSNEASSIITFYQSPSNTKHSLNFKEPEAFKDSKLFDCKMSIKLFKSHNSTIKPLKILIKQFSYIKNSLHKLNKELQPNFPMLGFFIIFFISCLAFDIKHWVYYFSKDYMWINIFWLFSLRLAKLIPVSNEKIHKIPTSLTLSCWSVS